MIPGDIAAELARLLAAQAEAGALPPAAAALTASGTWRPAGTGVPGSYATSLPFALASLAGQPPEALAARLAGPLAGLPWISAAQPAGGYLTITVTPGHLAGLPARIVAAGPASAHSDSLAGRSLTAPHLPDVVSMADWPHAWREQHAALTGLLGQAAGARVLFFHSESKAPATAPSDAGVSPPAAAVARFGVDAVRFALAAVPAPRSAAIERQLGRPLDLTNPFVKVRYARADAASTLRWAADLSLRADHPACGAVAWHPPELRLIDAMSWLPERVAAACRRRRPAELVAHLEHLARAWLECSERCSVLPFRGRAATAARENPAGTPARLELARAAGTTLAAGLGLIAVAAPAMM